MRVLVTGGTGFLGSHLCARLREDGHEVTALRRLTSNPADLAEHQISYVAGDVTDPAAVSQAIAGQEAVIHAAALVRYGAEPAKLDAVNEGGTRNVVTACRRLGVGRLVHVSSVAAIGIPADRRQPADETFAFNLEESGLRYHISKRRAEQAIARATAEGLDAVIVNPSAIHGPHGRGFRGSEVPDGVRHRRIVPCFAGGTNVVHVDDVADGVLAALRCGRTGERYILGGENLTWREMAQTAADLLGLRRFLVPVPAFVTGTVAWLGRAVQPLTQRRPRLTYDEHFCANRFLFYDSRKAARELGFTARPYVEIVRQYLESGSGAETRARAGGLPNA